MATTIKTYDGTVIAQHGLTTGTPAEGDPLAITYTVTADDPDVSLVLKHWMPERRIARGANVLVAKKGDWCVIRVTPTGTILLMMTEGVPYIEACSTGG